MADESSIAGRVGHGLGWSMSSNLVLRVGNFLVSIVVARLIAPEQFGVFAVALTVWTILGTLAEFGLGTDLVRARDPERRAPTIATIAVLTSCTLAVTMGLAADSIAALFVSPESTGVIRLMAVSLALFGFTIVPAARLQRAFRQRALFGVNIAGLLVSTTVLILMANSGAGPAALAWSQIVNQLVLVIGLHVATRSRPRFGFRGDVASESLAFCLPLAVANLLSWLLLSVGNLVVTRELGPHQLGLYVLAFNVSSWPMTAVGQALRVVALPAFSSVESAHARNQALVRCSAPVAAVAVVMGLLLSTMASPIVTFLYGERWRAAAAALAGLAVLGALRVIIDLVATFLIAVGTTVAVLVVQVVWLIAIVPVMLVGVSWFGLAGAGWAPVVVVIGVVFPAYAVCLARVGVDVRAFVRGWSVPLIAAVPACVACVLIDRGGGAPLVTLLGGGLAALLLYALPLRRWWLARIALLRTAAPLPETQGIVS